MQRAAVLVVVVALAGACGPEARTALPDGGAADARPDGSIDGAIQPDTSRVYAHSGNHLYRIDATDNHVIDVAPITGTGTSSITDIAVDKDDHMYGVSLSKLYTIDTTTGVATLVADLPTDVKPATSLSFVPTDLDDPNSDDILVTVNTAGEVYELDTATAAATLLGTYGETGGDVIHSSGDLIAIRGVGILATVTVGDDLTAHDFLASIDPTDWHATLKPTQTSFDRIFGLGFWGGKVYGFVDEGSAAGTGVLAEINATTGAATLLDRGHIRWFGAGVTTDAPIFE